MTPRSCGDAAAAAVRLVAAHVQHARVVVQLSHPTVEADLRAKQGGGGEGEGEEEKEEMQVKVRAKEEKGAIK